ncbi:DUF4239 domain-containing protein (plasmid) [Phyllobacterium zundukense]|uniref:bestrophin-like domain n=1 Tax=Phyllobacterium zundukense TaxID=1867719 RepID=UPI000C1BB2A9|nr:DUF4239 domain-containing protein [Phyllobacterium zundukense]ATU95869.1 DUF4239 domain-containing protein [Phyllobacterium zundukense]
MSALAIGGIVFICLSLAAMLGMVLRERLPDHHLSTESRDAIKLATAVVGTLSALALGFLIASAKTTFDDAEAELRTSVARLVLLDRVMAHYGPETATARRMLAELVEIRLRKAWGGRDDDQPATGGAMSDRGIEVVQDELRALSPDTDARGSLQSRGLEVSGQIAEAHWLLIEKDNEGLPWAFLAILVFWLALLFFTFGLLAPSNGTVVCVLFVCALSVAGAVFLIIDMAHPYLGFIQVSDAPLRTALANLGGN